MRKGSEIGTERKVSVASVEHCYRASSLPDLLDTDDPVPDALFNRSTPQVEHKASGERKMATSFDNTGARAGNRNGFYAGTNPESKSGKKLRHSFGDTAVSDAFLPAL